MAMLLLQQDGTVTVCHSKTPGLAAITREADILVSAVGRVGLVTPGMVKEGAVVIDVAMNRNSEGRLCGDVDFAAVEPKASYITPVPGGVGPMTRAMLMRNILTAAGTTRRRSEQTKRAPRPKAAALLICMGRSYRSSRKYARPRLAGADSPSCSAGRQKSAPRWSRDTAAC